MKPEFGRRQIWGILAVVIFFAGISVGTLIRRDRAAHAPASVPAQTATIAPTAIPSANQVAAAPHPAIESSDDPPATETSPHTVIEDEPRTPGVKPVAPAELSPPPQSSAAAEPPWRRFAVAAPAVSGRKMVAVIIDDMGLDRRRSKEILALPGPLTISFMSYAEDLAEQAAEAHADGHELMMHVPMEPVGNLDPGPGALLDSLSAEELHRRLVADLDRFTGYVGINNHMGSKFTASAPGMDIVMAELKRRGDLFIDSLTTDKSAGLTEARRFGVPSAARNVFLDDDPARAKVDEQLAKLEELALKKGNAIAIGHPKDATIAALKAWIPTLAAKGLVLVPVTAIVAARMTSDPSVQKADAVRPSH
jgi:polysaccharide deacetylase 2 family uncharacterized protein YibQ